MNICWHWWEHENIAETMLWKTYIIEISKEASGVSCWERYLEPSALYGKNLGSRGCYLPFSRGFAAWWQLGGVQLQVGNEGFRPLRICLKHRQIQMVRNTKQTKQHAKGTTVYNSVVSRPLISCCINFQNLRIAFEKTTEPQNVPSYSKQSKTPSSIIRAIRSNINSLELPQGSSITSHCRPQKMGNSQNVAGQFPSFCTSTCLLVKSMSFPPGCATKPAIWTLQNMV